MKLVEEGHCPARLTCSTFHDLREAKVEPICGPGEPWGEVVGPLQVSTVLGLWTSLLTQALWVIGGSPIARYPSRRLPGHWSQNGDLLEGSGPAGLVLSPLKLLIRS